MNPLTGLSRRLRGFSLVEVLVAAGVMSIIALGFMQMMSNQAKSTQAISEKLSALDFEKILMGAFSDGSLCTYVLTNPAFSANRIPNPAIFNSTNANAAIQLVKIPASANPAAPDLLPAKPLAIQAVSITKIQTTGTAGRWNAELNVTFDSSKLVRAIKPVTVSVALMTIPAAGPNNHQITGCSQAAPALPSGGCYVSGYINYNDTDCTAAGTGDPATSASGVGTKVCPAGWISRYFFAHDQGGSNSCQWLCCQP